MRFFTTTIFLLTFFSSSFSQDELACDGVRYINNVFTEVEKTTVTYGSNSNLLGFNQELEMDVYQPVGDVHEQRPVIILAFGGSFLVGSRETMEVYCEQFARMGYVAATIDYRLGFLGASGDAVTGAVMRAVSDMKGAIRYFRSDADSGNTFNIHPDYILVGGYSAGSITALHTAYLDENDDIPATTQTIIDENGGLEGNTGDSTNLSYSSEVFAVYNLSGGLAQKSWLDESETEPLVSYHGTDDATVPFVSGLAGGLAPIDGTSLLHEQANAFSLPNYVKVVEGGGHGDIYLDDFYQDDLVEFVLNSNIFLQNQMCPDFQVPILTDVEDLESNESLVSIFPNPSYDVINFDFGKINSDYTIRVYDQLGRMVATFENQNDVIFSLEKNRIGEGVFFVNILFEENNTIPILEKIIFQ